MAKKQTIVSTDKGRLILNGKASVTMSGMITDIDGESVVITQYGIRHKFYAGTTVDGEVMSTVKDLLEKLNSFNAGGGAPSGSTGVQGGQIIGIGNNTLGQQIVFDTGISDLDNAVVTPVNMAARDAGIQFYDVVNGVITITILQAPQDTELIYSFAAVSDSGSTPSNYVTKSQLNQALDTQKTWVQENFINKPEFKQQGRSIVLMGDSNTQSNGAGKYSEGNWLNSIGTEGYFTWCNALMYQTFTDVVNCGIGSQTSTQIRERFQVDVIDAKPNFVALMACTNDSRATEADVQISIDNLKYMYDLAIENNITVIALSIYWATNRVDGGVDDTRVKFINEWIRDYSLNNPNIWFLDTDTVLRNQPQMFKDAVHLNSTGGYHVGLALSKLLKPLEVRMELPKVGDVGIITANPFMLGAIQTVSADVYASGTTFLNISRRGGSGNEQTVLYEAYRNEKGESLLNITARTDINGVARNTSTSAGILQARDFEGFSILEFRILDINTATPETSILVNNNTVNGRVYGTLPVIKNSPWVLLKTPTRPQVNNECSFMNISLPAGDISNRTLKVQIRTVCKIEI